jgi:hypothetical protein
MKEDTPHFFPHWGPFYVLPTGRGGIHCHQFDLESWQVLLIAGTFSTCLIGNMILLVVIFVISRIRN